MICYTVVFLIFVLVITVIVGVDAHSDERLNIIETPRRLSGTCGGGSVGNGICSDNTLCCSINGWCGSTNAYCGNKANTPAPVPKPPGTCGSGSVGNAICTDPTLCCSIYGYCGNTNDYCGNQATTAAPFAPFSPVTPYPTPRPVPTPPANCGSLSNVMTVNFGYYASWASTRALNCNQVLPQTINVTGNHYTHLAYAFAGINTSDQIAPTDNDYAGEVPQYVEFNSLKKSNPGLKTLISVGGGSFNGNLFSEIAASTTRSATFAASMIVFLQTVRTQATMFRF
jgi:chitinase